MPTCARSALPHAIRDGHTCVDLERLCNRFQRSWIRILGASLIVISGAAPASAAEVVISEEARAHFSAGVNLLQDPDGARYEEAYREFEEAYARSPSWKILGNLGISAMKLERDGEAIEAYQKYLAEGGKQISADERAQFQRDLATLEAGAVRLTLQTDPPGATIEDERFPAIGAGIRNTYSSNGPLEIAVRPGRHRFTAKLTGRVDAVWEVELSPRHQRSHTFVLSDPVTTSAPVAAPVAPFASKAAAVDRSDAKPGNGMRVGAYAALGVGVVGLGVGTVFGLEANRNYKDANAITNNPDNCSRSGPCVLSPALFDEREKFSDDGHSAKILSIVGFALGGVGLATATTLFILSSEKEESAAAKVEPYLGVGNLGVRGSF